MNAPQLIRAAGNLARLVGLAEAHARLVALEELATLEDVVDLAAEVLERVDAEAEREALRARPAREASPAEPRARSTYTEAQIADVVALASNGLHDPAIAARLGLPPRPSDASGDATVWQETPSRTRPRDGRSGSAPHTPAA